MIRAPNLHIVHVNISVCTPLRTRALSSFIVSLCIADCMRTTTCVYIDHVQLHVYICKADCIHVYICNENHMCTIACVCIHRRLRMYNYIHMYDAEGICMIMCI
jgi:hypothetical protein